jgi:hypothetical protein
MKDHRSFRDGGFIIEGVIQTVEVVVGVVRHCRAGVASFASQEVGIRTKIFESKGEKMKF